MKRTNAKFQGERLRELREEKQLCQKNVAYHLRVSQAAYSKYELGKTPLPIDYLPAIAAYLNVDPDYLLGVIDYPSPYPANTTISNSCEKFLLNLTNNEGNITNKKIDFDEEYTKLLNESLPEDYAEKTFALLEEKEAFKATLPPEAAETFDLIDTHNEGLHITENEAHYIAGFKSGVNLILSVISAR